MLQPVEKEKNLSNLVMNFDPELAGLLPTLGTSTGCGSVSLNPSGRASPRERSVAEAVLSRRLMGKLEEKLKQVEMWETFQSKIISSDFVNFLPLFFQILVTRYHRNSIKIISFLRHFKIIVFLMLPTLITYSENTAPILLDIFCFLFRN